jgi:hypothetical protein
VTTGQSSFLEWALESDAVNAATGAVSQAQMIGESGTIAADPGGRFVYLAGSATLSGYTVDAVDAALTPIPGSPYSIPASATAMAVDASGRFLYVGLSSGLLGYRIDAATGALTPIAGGISQRRGRKVSVCRRQRRVGSGD